MKISECRVAQCTPIALSVLVVVLLLAPLAKARQPEVSSPDDSLATFPKPVLTLPTLTVRGWRLLQKLSDSEVPGYEVQRQPLHQGYDVFTIAPGMVRRGRDLVFRGGTRSDIDYQIEGISVRDPQTGGFAASSPPLGIGSIEVVPGGLTNNTGNGRGALLDVKLMDPTSNKLVVSTGGGSYATADCDALYSRVAGSGGDILALSATSSRAITLDSRLPADYEPYSRLLRSDGVFPEEHNGGYRASVAGKRLRRGERGSVFSSFANFSREDGDNPPLVHNGTTFSPTDIAAMIAGGKLRAGLYDGYPYSRPWGGEISATTVLLGAEYMRPFSKRIVMELSPFAFLTARDRQDHEGSWFFETGFGGGYYSTRTHLQSGMKASIVTALPRQLVLAFNSEYRYTHLNYHSTMNATSIDTYGNIRGNFYKGFEYTDSATTAPASPYFGWPSPKARVPTLVERYGGGYFQLVNMLVASYEPKVVVGPIRSVELRAGAKNTTSDIGRGFSLTDPFVLASFGTHSIFSANLGYSHALQLPNVYQAFANHYDPYSWGFDGTYDAEGNPRIGPERSKGFEGGFRARFPNVEIGLTGYTRRTYDNVVTVSAPWAAGAEVPSTVASHYRQYANGGNGKASGWEPSLSIRMPGNGRVRLVGQIAAHSSQRSTPGGPITRTAYDQRNTLHFVYSQPWRGTVIQLHAEYGSGLPYRWREMQTDSTGSTVQIARHDYDRTVPAHFVVNMSMGTRLWRSLEATLAVTNLQGVLDPICGWGANQYVEYRDSDSVQNPVGIPRYGYASLKSVILGVRWTWAKD